MQRWRRLTGRSGTGVRRVQEPRVPPIAGPNLLTPRQTVILALVASGHKQREIARRLDVSLQTVKNLLRDAYTRLGARSAAHAVALWKEAA